MSHYELLPPRRQTVSNALFHGNEMPEAGGALSLAAAHEAPDGTHELLRALLTARSPLGHHARARVSVEKPERDLVQGRLDGGDLREHVYAVAIILDHLLDAAHLPSDTSEAREQLVLCGLVAPAGP